MSSRRSLAWELQARGVSLEDVLGHLEASITLLDRTGKIVWQNEFSLARVGDRRGTNFLAVIAPDHKRVSETEFTRLLFNADASSRREIVVMGPDGRRMRTIVFSVPVRGETDRVDGVLAIGIPVNWNDTSSAAPELTPRQLQTLELLAAGRSTQEIADELGIAIETARNHIRGVLKRLGASSRLAAVARARELQIGEGESPRSEPE